MAAHPVVGREVPEELFVPVALRARRTARTGVCPGVALGSELGVSARRIPNPATRLIEQIEAAGAIDGWSAAVRPTIVALVGSGRRRDVLTGRWLGHAVHPAAVLAPLGCWVGAAVVDIGGGHGARRLARRLVGTGVAAAAPALASGAADWVDTDRAERRVGTAHALLNNLSLAAMTVSWMVRRRGHHRAGMVCSGAGLGGVLVAGLLGGHLAYARGVGVSTTAFQAGPDEWTRLIDVDELTAGQPTAASLRGVGYVVVRGDETVHVHENRCTHRGGPLAEGTIADGCIECPWHGSRFALDDGSVRAGPASVPQPAYDARIVDGAVEIRRTELGGLRASSVHPDR